jgi:catechol 2,3-dioxygenase-like lactoylglutathione lyase family enzyme
MFVSAGGGECRHALLQNDGPTVHRCWEVLSSQLRWRGACRCRFPPRVSVVALRTADLARSTAFYTALGWELSPASTPAMLMFQTAGSLLLVCDDGLLAELGGEEVAAALAGQAKGEAVLSIHVATDGEVDAAVQAVARAGGVVVKPAVPTPLGGSYAFFADPDGHLWEVIHHPLYRLGADGRPQVP